MEDAYDSPGVLQQVLDAQPTAVLSVVLVIGLLIGGAGIAALDVGTSNTAPPPAPDTVVSESDYTPVYENTSKSVVSIYANGPNGTSSQGSGFVYDANGHVVTNWHVISNGDDIHIRYSNGEWATAEVVGTDAYTDLAVLKVSDRPDYAKPLPVADGVPDVGMRVMALGSPDDLRGSMTVGVVSGVNRSMQTPQGFVIPDMVQTDASLNPGNSGGPLVTTDGTVVGVNRARQGENIGFAVSGRIIHAVVPSLLEDGAHRHSLVGIRGTPMSPTVAEANGMDLRDGILVTEVVEGGPSDGVLQGGGGESIEHNGFEVYKGGDLIIAVDGNPITTNEGLTSYLMRQTQPGDTVEFTIIRDGERQTVEVTLSERPPYGGSP